MFLSKKSMFKDGSFLPILSQSGTMLHFPGYFLSSRGTLENLFVRFERLQSSDRPARLPLFANVIF